MVVEFTTIGGDESKGEAISPQRAQGFLAALEMFQNTPGYRVYYFPRPFIIKL